MQKTEEFRCANMKENKLVKEKECIHCESFFDCKGKPPGKLCNLFKEVKRKETKKSIFGY